MNLSLIKYFLKAKLNVVFLGFALNFKVKKLIPFLESVKLIFFIEIIVSLVLRTR